LLCIFKESFKREGVGKGEIRKYDKGTEYGQTTLYACIEISQ
jgi:hypothetical protein